MPEPKPVGIWIRVSPEDQAQGESPKRQEEQARLYAQAKGWKVQEVYRLEAASKPAMEQPEAQRMFGDVRAGRITGIICSKLACLARNTKELLEFSAILQKYHADLISLQEAIDTSASYGFPIHSIVATMAQWVREGIAEGVKASVRVRAKQGKPLGGQAPFGYQWADEQLVPDPQEAPIRRRIYELFLEHKRKKTVARLLNDAGYRTRAGAKFSDTTIGRLLEDPIAKGLHRANYTRSLGTNAKWELKPEEEWAYSAVEPIISEELWERCHRILESQRTNQPPPRQAVHLFSGLVFCSCGAKMYVLSNSVKYTCRKCRSKIVADDLEDVFREQLRSFVLPRREIVKHLDQADQRVKQRIDLAESLVAEERKTRQELDKVYDLYIKGQISNEGFAERYHPLEERLSQIGDEIVSVQVEADSLRIRHLFDDSALSETPDLYARWPQLLPGQKRRVVESIVESIVIGPEDKIDINLRRPPHTPK